MERNEIAEQLEEAREGWITQRGETASINFVKQSPSGGENKTNHTFEMLSERISREEI